MKIYGLRPNGDVASISVYQKGRSVRLSGPNGPHNVHPSNVGNSDGWISAIALIAAFAASLPFNVATPAHPLYGLIVAGTALVTILILTIVII
jgi:hypothetical protein